MLIAEDSRIILKGADFNGIVTAADRIVFDLLQNDKEIRFDPDVYDKTYDPSIGKFIYILKPQVKNITGGWNTVDFALRMGPEETGSVRIINSDTYYSLIRRKPRNYVFLLTEDNRVISKEIVAMTEISKTVGFLNPNNKTNIVITTRWDDVRRTCKLRE